MSSPFIRACAAAALVAATAPLTAQPRPQSSFDLLIVNGTVVDGTGAPAFRADVAITGDRIVRVEPKGLDARQARLTLDAAGLIVAPGFIDQHAHVQNIADFPLAETHLRQGITSIVSSPHSGEQVYPLGRYIATLKAAPNLGYYAGHSTIRRKVMGDAARAATPAEMEKMKSLVAEYMQDGALGLSTGLAIPPGSHAPIEELIELARVAGAQGGIYVSHIRDDSDGVVDAVQELLRVVEGANIPGQISHHTVSGAAQWGWTAKTLGLVDAARARGFDVAFDIFPYTATYVASDVMLPRWLLEGAPREAPARGRWLADRLRDPALRARAESETAAIFNREYVGDALARVRIVKAASPRLAGQTLEQLARDRSLSSTANTAARLLLDLEAEGGFTAAVDSIDEDDLRRLMRHPVALFDTEDRLVGLGDGLPQPRTYGSFPRILARYVRDQHLLTMEEAIRKMTSQSADQIGQSDRGRIREGAFADVTVFDAATITDRATFEDPHQFSVGVRHVIVNGVPVIRGGALTGEKPGRALKGPARRQAKK